MANVETVVLKPYMKTSAGQYNVFGIIGFSGDLTGNGYGKLHAPLVRLRNWWKHFTGVADGAGVGQQFADAIGELANMIAGSAKSKLGLDARYHRPPAFSWAITATYRHAQRHAVHRDSLHHCAWRLRW